MLKKIGAQFQTEEYNEREKKTHLSWCTDVCLFEVVYWERKRNEKKTTFRNPLTSSTTNCPKDKFIRKINLLKQHIRGGTLLNFYDQIWEYAERRDVT